MTKNNASHLSDQERLQLLIDAVIDYAIYMLDVDGRIVSWNSGAQRLKGYTPAEIVGQHFDRFCRSARPWKPSDPRPDRDAS
jgi:PAS domain S-box-containing protein